MNARGQVTTEYRGVDNQVASPQPSVTTISLYSSSTGRLLSIDGMNTTGLDVQDLDYSWNTVGNLLSRQEMSGTKSLSESFGYDGLNRLTSQTVSGQSSVTISYNGIGNITNKSDVGSYTYGAGNAGPHAVTGAGGAIYAYDSNGNNTSGDGRTVQYTTFDKPDQISKDGHTTSFAYGPDRARYRRVDDGASGIKTTRFIGNVEIIFRPNGDQDRKRYIAGTAIETIHFGDNSIEDFRETHYQHLDHLGSLDVITDSTGAIVQEQSFDAWGQRRNASDWMNFTPMQLTTFEHSLDPMNTQSLNRYSYLWNNPLNATDPSGFISLKKILRIGLSIVASIYLPGSSGLLANWGIASTELARGVITGFVAGAIATGTLKGAAIGAFSGAVFHGLNKLFTEGSGVPRSGLDSKSITPSKRVIDQMYGEAGPQVGHHRIVINPESGMFMDARPIGVSGIESGDTIFTNGLSNDFADGVRNGTTQLFQRNIESSSYVLNFNPTESFPIDLAESAVDVLGANIGIAHSKLAKDLARVLNTASENGVTGLRLIGHSQGGAITISALRYAAKTGLDVSSVGSVMLHGAPVNILATRSISKRFDDLSIASHAQFGDPVHVFGGLNIQNPLQVLGALYRGPTVFSQDASLSPHTVPCYGGRNGRCSP